MKLFIFLLFIPLLVPAQNLTPDEQRQLLNEVKSLKERVNTLESKDSGQGFRQTDYKDKTTASEAAPAAKGPAMTDEQRKEVAEAMEKYKKAREEHDKALKELENEDE